MSDAERIRLIDALLPQTQCGQCGHPGCRPYAEAIAAGEAINHCVPGGQATIDALSDLLQTPSLALDPEYGVAPTQRLVAFIREAECIGCTKCIQACPVDAIVGAAKRMHTVMVDECTGCDLCLAPCPVDCIDMVPGPAVPLTWHAPARIDPRSGIASLPPATPDAMQLAARARAERARQRFETHQARVARQQAQRRRPGAVATSPAPLTAGSETRPDTGPLLIAAAMARSQLRKLEKQRAALQARGADTQALDAQMPALQDAVTTAETALAAAERGDLPAGVIITADTLPASGLATDVPDAATSAQPPRSGPGRHRVRTTGEIR